MYFMYAVLGTIFYAVTQFNNRTNIEEIQVTRTGRCYGGVLTTDIHKQIR